MIKQLEINGFKSFYHQKFSLNNLTILTGLNNCGKSSVIQSLLMMEKDFKHENSILIEGLGPIQEIKNNDYKGNIKLSCLNEKMHEFEVKISDQKEDEPNIIIMSNFFEFPEIIYISANRFGPRTLLPIFNETDKIGPNGENLFNVIDKYGDQNLDNILRHEKSEGYTFLYNIRGWLSVISPNVKFEYRIDRRNDSSYSLFNDHRANNVGFGLSYALPVISALLLGTLKKGSLVIIENPEAHLHPKGQTEIAKLICLCVQAGAQVIIETHSDHLFDGVRIFAKENDNFFEKVQLIWFELDERHNTKLSFPKLDDNGRVDDWPKNFFNQFETNASKLL